MYAYASIRMEIRRGGVEGEMQERVPLTIFNDIALTKRIRIVFHAYVQALTRLPLFLLIIPRVLEEKEKKPTKKSVRRWNIQ